MTSVLFFYLNKLQLIQILLRVITMIYPTIKLVDE